MKSEMNSSLCEKQKRFSDINKNEHLFMKNLRVHL